MLFDMERKYFKHNVSEGYVFSSKHYFSESLKGYNPFITLLKISAF